MPRTLARSHAGTLPHLQVNRAVSEAVFGELDGFYVDGMGTTKTTDETGADYGKKCYQWPGATVQVCFTHRADSYTKGDWKVGDFEKMLKTVHTNILGKTPSCGVDKWFDNHYAIDSFSADTSKILSYVESAKVLHYCNGGSLHYVFDPTGWGIQLDMQFSSAPSDCSSSSSSSSSVSTVFKDTMLRSSVKGTFNPACQPGTCN